MSKILLIGNGLTSILIPAYRNEQMMPKIKAQVPEIFEKADTLFNPFRKKVDRVQYATVGWGYSGSFLFSGAPSFFHPIADLLYNSELLDHLENLPLAQRFDKSILKQYFQTYGLIY